MWPFSPHVPLSSLHILSYPCWIWLDEMKDEGVSIVKDQFLELVFGENGHRNVSLELRFMVDFTSTWTFIRTAISIASLFEHSRRSLTSPPPHACIHLPIEGVNLDRQQAYAWLFSIALYYSLCAERLAVLLPSLLDFVPISQMPQVRNDCQTYHHLTPWELSKWHWKEK